MPQLYDYEKYYASMKAAAKVKLDLSGIPLKTLASIQDADGEVALNERVTNNVMEYVHTVSVTYDGGNVQLGMDTENRTVRMRYEDVDVFVAPGYMADEFVSSGLVKANLTQYRRQPDTLVSGQVVVLPDDAPGENHGPLSMYLETYTEDSPIPVSVPVSSVTVSYIPRYHLMVDPTLGYAQSQNFGWIGNVHVYKASLGVLGFDRVREHGRKWFTRTAAKDSRAVVGYDSLQKTLKYMTEYYNESGVGIEVTYLDNKFKQPVSVEPPTAEEWKLSRSAARAKQKLYDAEVARNDLGYTTTDMRSNARYSSLAGYLGTFDTGWLHDVNSTYAELTGGDGLVNSIAGLEENQGTGTVIIPSVCDAFKSFYYSKDELTSEFNDAFTDVSDEMKGARGKPASARRTLAKFARIVNELNYEPANVNRYAIDLAEIKRSMFTNGCPETVFSALGYVPREISLRLRAIGISGNNEYFTEYNNVKDLDGLRNRPAMTVPTGFYTADGLWIGPGDPDQFFTSHPYVHFDGMDEYDFYIRKKVSAEVDSGYVLNALIGWYNEWCTHWSAAKSYSNGGLSDARVWDTLDSFLNDAHPAANAALLGRYLSGELGGNAYAGGVISYVGVTFGTTTRNYLSWYNGLGYMTLDCSSYTMQGTGQGTQFCLDSCNYGTHSVGGGWFVYTLAQFATEACILVRAVQNAIGTGGAPAVNTWAPVNSNWRLPEKITVIGTDETVFDLTDENPDADDYDEIEIQYDEDVQLNDVDISMPFFVDSVLPAYRSMLASWRDWLDDRKKKMFSSLIGRAAAALLTFSNYTEAYENAKSAYDRLIDAVEKIRYYEYVTHESVFDNKSMMYGGYSELNFKVVPARFMLPVAMYKKVRKRYRRFGFVRHRTVKRSIGVRWAEIRFIDTNAYAEYPQLPEDTYSVYPVNQYGTIEGDDAVGYAVTVPEAVEGTGNIGPGAISTQGSVVIDLMVAGGYVYSYGATPESDTRYIVDDPDFSPEAIGSGFTLLNVKVPLPSSQGDDKLTNVELRYSMPSLPRPNEIRHKSFVDYGPFDQSKNSVVERRGNEYAGYLDDTGKFVYDTDQFGNLVPLVDRVDGWRIFHETSGKISDMRKGLGVFDAVASLLGILRAEFGERRVELCETMRSSEDEALVCSGGPESEFLSWHNYGLGVKILIYENDMKTPLSGTGEDFRKLIDIAEAFTAAAHDARVCPTPLNVVWCGRLVMGANIFCWEFLPIGVEHRDAPKFREAILERMDPVERWAFVNVDALGYAVDRVPSGNTPYVLRNSDVYRDAIVAAGQHYVDPAKVVNYLPGHIHTDLLLINVIEFIKMVQLKMAANGSSLTERANLYEWKAVNETSFRQLVTYFGMVGNLSGARSLIAGDFVERYQNIVDMYYTTDIVEFVKSMLGPMYSDAKVYITGMGDGGAFISLADGRIHVFGESSRSMYDQNYGGNVFGERQVTPTKLVRGIERDGVFYTIEEAKARGLDVEYVSDGSVLSGYEVSADGTVSVVGGDARLLHAIAGSQIKAQYDKLKSMFENYGGPVMYDHYEDGPNAGNSDMLENEFGIIAGQTLMDFGQLRSMVDKMNVGSNGFGTGKLMDNSYGDLDGNGMPLESVFEKVVSNAQLSGVRRASLTREHVIEVPRSNGLSVEKIYKILTAGKKVMANDLMRRR